jgi:hypothetical protein
MAVSSHLSSILGPLPGFPRHDLIMRSRLRGHIVEIAEPITEFVVRVSVRASP